MQEGREDSFCCRTGDETRELGSGGAEEELLESTYLVPWQKRLVD